MVNSVVSPKARTAMECAMTPITDEVGKHEHFHGLEPEWLVTKPRVTVHEGAQAFGLQRLRQNEGGRR